MFSESVIKFFRGLEYGGSLPPGISVMNPFRDNPDILPVITQFYNKFYYDSSPRYLIMGINPGIPFTDSKRLSEKCGLSIPGLKTFETSSVFVYEMIEAFGGVEQFYNKFYISAVCPLGFTLINKKGKNINYNYYDNNKLISAVKDFIIDSLAKQLEFGIRRETCFCLGTGKNYKFLIQLNNDLKVFDKIVPLEHPRFIMQYKTKQKNIYINKYIDELGKV
jgi:hypothetical protein